MLRQVSNGQYLEAIRMAEKFILHVEVLFATIDDLETCFARMNLKGNLLRYMHDGYLKANSSLPPKACPTFVRHDYYVARQWTCSLSFLVPKKVRKGLG